MAKRNRRSVQSTTKPSFHWTAWIVAIAAVVALVAIFSRPKSGTDSPSNIIPSRVTSENSAAPRRKNFPQSSEEEKRQATAYAEKVVNPILIKHALDPKEIPAIRNRLMEFSRQNQTGKLGYEMQPVRSPWGPTTVAKTQYNDEGTKRVIMGFAPQIKEDEAEFKMQGRPQDFEDYVVLTFAHEMVHVELMEAKPEHDEQARLGWTNRELMLKDEAEAWGITIIEILRPMIAKNRWAPKTMSDASKWLKELSDNYEDPRWINGFQNYHPK